MPSSCGDTVSRHAGVSGSQTESAMPSDPFSVSAPRDKQGELAPGGHCSNAPRLSDDQAKSIAQLIANGDLSLISDIHPGDRSSVLKLAAELRRKRLTSYIAHEIAADIRRSRAQGEG
jgi:hypothetical protein